MKTKIQHLFLTLLFIGIFACENQNQDWAGINSMEVSIAHADSLRKYFPDASYIEWELESGYYVANFRADGFEKSAWFDHAAEWKMTETETPFKLIPEVIQDVIGENYSHRKVEIEEIERPLFVDAYFLDEENKEILALKTGLIVDETLNDSLIEILPVNLPNGVLDVLGDSIPDFRLGNVKFTNNVWKIILLNSDNIPFSVIIDQKFKMLENNILTSQKEK